MSRALAAMVLALGSASGSAKAQDAAEGEACGSFHVGTSSWAVECEPGLRCEVDRTEIWGELGTCAVQACALDEDCEQGAWCRDTEDQNRECVPFVGAGERCEGYTLPWSFERCEPGLQCVFSEPTGDVPGTCASCVYDGTPLQTGETFPADDGCTTCTCTEGGRIACTERACTKRCGGLRGLRCDRWEFCDYPASAMCGAADQMGVCRSIAEKCTDQLDPVCGCDDQTYSNACEANAVGVSVAQKGACDSADICELPRAPGRCRAHIPRFYFDADSGQCERFIYGGCRGNENNFASLDECRRACQPRPTTCKVGGCSGQLCVGPGDPDISTCEWRPEYACYGSATCEVQASGKCGWTKTDELLECLNDAR